MNPQSISSLTDKNQINPGLCPPNFITVFSVVRGGDGPDMSLPITPFANFQTEHEATSFQAKALTAFPGCRVAKQCFRAKDGASHQEMMETHFDFMLKITTDELAPRAKRGNMLHMRSGLVAEDGDIVAVAIGHGDQLLIRLEFYTAGMDYFAVSTGMTTTNDSFNPHRQVEDGDMDKHHAESQEHARVTK